MIEITLTQGYITVVDDCDIDLSKLRWYAKSSGNNYYAIRMDKKGKRSIRLHRVILSRILGRDLLDTEYCDHINGNTFDNRRANLRVCTRSQNQMNRKIAKNNTSGFKGVSWSKNIKKWWASIKINQVKINLGYFDDPKEAYKAYCEAAPKYFGEFARFE